MGNLATGLAVAASNTAATPGAPWYGKLIAGVIAVVLGIAIAWGKKNNKISLGDYDDILQWAGYMFIAGGGALMAWSVGVFN